MKSCISSQRLNLSLLAPHVVIMVLKTLPPLQLMQICFMAGGLLIPPVLEEVRIEPGYPHLTHSHMLEVLNPKRGVTSHSSLVHQTTAALCLSLDLQLEKQCHAISLHAAFQSFHKFYFVWLMNLQRKKGCVMMENLMSFLVLQAE